MAYLDRRNAAKQARALANYLETHPGEYCITSTPLWLREMADKICLATPSVYELFELNRDNYEYRTVIQVPRSIRMRHTGVEAYVRKEVCRRWYMSVVKAGGASPKVLSSREFDPDGTMYISTPSYPYALCVTAHETSEPDVYQIVVNINE